MKQKAMSVPEAMPERFKEAWNRYEASEIAELFSDQPDFINVTGKWWDNREDIQKAHDFGFRVIFPDSHLKVLKVKKKMLAENIAVIHARIRVTGQTEEQVD